MKEKLNNKVMAIMLLLVLLAGTFGVAMNVGPTLAQTETKYLTISYLPFEMPKPATVPAVGTYELAKGWNGPVEAPDIVETADSGIRYVFVQWAMWWEETQEWHNFTDNPHTVTLDQNKTAYAEYKVEYKLTVETKYSKPYSQVDGEGWVPHPPDRWFDADIKVRAGVDDSEVVLEPNKKAVFEKWVINDVDDGTNRIGDWFFMDGPKTAVAVWKIQYYLYVKAAPPEPRPDLVPTPPDGEDWYYECTYVHLEAPETQLATSEWRLRFDYWDVDGIPQAPGVNPIDVHMDTNHTATAHYWLQYKLWVKTDPADIVEIPGTDFYDTCTDVTLEADDVYISDVIRYAFYKWVVTNVGTFDTKEIKFHVPHTLPTLPFVATAYYTLQYYLEVKDNIDGLSCVSTQSDWFDKTTTVPLSAPLTVEVDEGTQYYFVKWVKDPGAYEDINTETTIKMTGPRVATAYYKLQYLVTWKSEPVPVFEGEKWFDNCTVDYPYAWPTVWDDPTSPIDWVFDHWTVNGEPRPRGKNPIEVHYGQPTELIAYYRQQSAFIMTPQSIYETVDPYVEPCTRTFKVNITAANFEDLYGIDFKITWDANLIELVDADVELDEIWTQSFWWDEIGAGWYQLVGTSLDEAGFYGTHKIVELTFHIKYEPCYDDVRTTDIEFDHVILSNSNAGEIVPELLLGAEYEIKSVKPKLELRESEIRANSFPFSFTVQLWAVNVIKLNSYWVEIGYDPDVFEVVKVVIHDDFLKGPTFTSHSYSTYSDFIVIWVEQGNGMPLARGEGLLASITFKLKYGIIWNTDDPEILSYINFNYADIDVHCPDYRLLWAPDYLDVEGVTFRYLPKPGDVNMDGVVGLEDLRIIAMHYGEGSYNPYDLNLNGKVDLFDLVLVAINYESE